MNHIQKTDPEIYAAIMNELKRERENLNLLPARILLPWPCWKPRDV